MSKKYKNPPVVEAWIDFRFEYGEESSEWDGKIATDFVKSFNEFKKEEYPALFRKGLKVNEKGLIISEENIFVRLKAFNEANDRCLQVEKKLLVYNMLRKKDVEWPGFSVLLEETTPYLESYIDKFHPMRIKAVLHYRDHVVVPFTDSKIEPSDYFEVYPKVPENEFGNMIDYSLSLILADTCNDGVTRFSVRTEPDSPEIEAGEPKMPFVLDWDVQSKTSFACDDLSACRSWLDSAHKDLSLAFEGCLTQKCRSLFE